MAVEMAVVARKQNFKPLLWSDLKANFLALEWATQSAYSNALQ